jgi:hypothetical protein
MSFLDEYLKGIAKYEDELKVREPDAFVGYSILFDIIDAMNKAMNKLGTQPSRRFRDCREVVFNIDTKVNHLLLIVRRLTGTSLSSSFSVSGAENKVHHYFRIDLEVFFYFAQSILDLAARLTPCFYAPQPRGCKCSSFREHRTWFMQNKSVDPEYSKYLTERTGWFDELKGHRDDLTHYTTIYFFWGEYPPKPFFGTRRNYKGFIPNQDVMVYVRNTTDSLIEFLRFFNNHFSNKIKT